MNKILILLACFVFLVVFSGGVGAVTNVTGCGTLSIADETYVLQNDISASGTCFTIGADGIILDGAGYSITGNSNSYGVYLYGRSGVTVKNLTVRGFWRGIYLLSISNNNTITNNTASNNWYGIFFKEYSNSNTFTDNTASNNSEDGILLSTSSDNALTNNTVSNNNGDGIYLEDSSNYNTLTNNTANSNNNRGIYLDSSSYNTIYNNFFNNSNNYRFFGGYSNTWSITQTPGINIVGGHYLGGNFWATPSGTGFSEQCTDADGDGICDSVYTLKSGNVDYLPLSLNFTDTTPPGDVNTTVIQRLDYYFNVTWTIPSDPDLKEFNIYQRQNDNSSTDTLIDTVPANYTQPYIAGPGTDDGNFYQYMVTAVDTSDNEGNGTYAPIGSPVPPIPFAPLGTLAVLGSGLIAYGYYRRKME